MLREVFADQLNRRDDDALMQGRGGPAHRPVEVKA